MHRPSRRVSSVCICGDQHFGRRGVLWFPSTVPSSSLGLLPRFALGCSVGVRNSNFALLFALSGLRLRSQLWDVFRSGCWKGGQPANQPNPAAWLPRNASKIAYSFPFAVTRTEELTEGEGWES
jgi:hypothetical protein